MATVRLLALALSHGPKKIGAAAAVLAACAQTHENAQPATPHAAATATRPRVDPTDCVRAAEDAARWIRSTAIETPHGCVWPADPNDPKSVSTNLYSGSAGIVVFFLAANMATGKAEYLTDARRGADHLLATIPTKLEGEEAGLYTGIAGVAFALHETSKLTKDQQYAGGARACVDLLAREAKPAGAGVQWNDSNDVISGSAGIGLFLLSMGDSRSVELAKKAGDRLLEVGIPEKGGLEWRISPNYPRFMPNFSHGTAGVAYFLARLHQATGDQRYLDGALAGARYLVAVADTSDGGCRIFHADPDGLDRYYLGWCHGPAGTARLFERLYAITGDAQWQDWFERCVASILRSGIPEKGPDGYWNNVGQCCGAAGIAQFLCYAMVQVRKDNKTYLWWIPDDLAHRLAADLLARGVRDDRGLRWPQAEHRVKPELIAAQTGYMQGAAGVGMFLLNLSRANPYCEEPLIHFPDERDYGRF